MLAVTRTPRILVKTSAAPDRASLRFDDSRPAFRMRIERLFDSIRPPGHGITGQPEWHIMQPEATGAEVNAWDLCHAAIRDGFGVAGMQPAVFAEPDFEQEWVTGTPAQHAFAAARTCGDPMPPASDVPAGEGHFWFRDAAHSQLERARSAVGRPSDRVRIAHFDTGYDPDHATAPVHLRRDLQHNFVDRGRSHDAADITSGVLTNLGHGAGTIGILAGSAIDGVPLGGAPFLDIIPIRVANSVVLFRNSAIARAFDYVHALFGNSQTRAHVITMSMGGLASQAWADAVNALYELGVFIVTAAGNNFGRMPVNSIVYPARFGRVVAACGVMADGAPYADLPVNIMCGNYGPKSTMGTAMAAYTPNTPWAKLGCGDLIDFDGRGTSSATPQIAAAAALWIQKYKSEWEAYTQGWMRVEAVRRALFDTARKTAGLESRLGKGILQADSALSVRPAPESSLRMEPGDKVSFAFFRLITGLGADDAGAQRMLELEAMQIAQRSRELELLIPDPAESPELSSADRQRAIELLHDAPGASKALRDALTPHVAPVLPRKPVVPETPGKADAERIHYAMDPPVLPPEIRKLNVFAFDPLVGTSPDMLGINQTTLDIRWEELKPGPVGEYVEVVDVDPATGCCYAPVDLNHPSILAQDGLTPSESSPRFHQQMVYAVAMKTIEHFERALGRVALWAPRIVKISDDHIEHHYVQRLRIYPHAVRERNAFYSPEKKALLLGYFPASRRNPGLNLPGGTVFCALSHDIVAHEVSHALLDGLHRYYREPTNEDMLAFHEAFSDIVALFQHFTVPEALRDTIRRTRGDLRRENLLADLARQFGQAVGSHAALRTALGSPPTGAEYQNAVEAHDRGAVLLSAVFDAFLDIYTRRSADLIRLATGGTGVLPEGDISYDLVNRLSQEAARTARHVLTICIRALDYCPPVDLRFGEYIRALVTADRELVPRDTLGYRSAFIQGFRRRGIYPSDVRSLSAESLCWERPEIQIPADFLLDEEHLGWDLSIDRAKAFRTSRASAARLQSLILNQLGDEQTQALGFFRRPADSLNGQPGILRPFEVHSVRPVRRIGPDGQQRTDLVIEITQSWLPAAGGGKFRGGCTLLVDLEQRRVRYVIRKRIDHAGRMTDQQRFEKKVAKDNIGFNYFGDRRTRREPFAMMHRYMGMEAADAV